MYQCCIFDLDGTLINSLRSLEYTVNKTLKQFGRGPISDDQVKQFIGDGYQKLVERALISCGDTELICAPEVLSVYLKNFERYCSYQIQAYPGIKELLDELKRKQIKIAVLSNKLHQRTVENIEMVFGKDYFDCVYGERQGIKIKPDPEGVNIILDELGVTNDQCLYFGDTNTDMQTGQAAAVDTVGVTWGFRDRSELAAFQPKYIIDHPSEVLDRIIISR